MAKGPSFLDNNAHRHRARTDQRYSELRGCAEIDVQALRVKLSVEAVRERGGLSYEEKLLLKQKIAEIQRKKEFRECRMERRNEKLVLGNFICGCDPEDPHVKTYQTNLVPGPNGQKVLTSKRYDKDGFEVCPIHGARMYGWRTHRKGDEQKHFLEEYGPTPKGPIASTAPDIRDTRDATEVGLAYLNRRKKRK